MKTVLTAAAAAFALALAGTAVAQNQPRDTGRAEIYKTADLLGKAIRNKAGEHIGYLEDLVVDISTGKAVYAALNTREAVGFGGKLYALPLSAFTMSDDLKALTIDANRADFDKAEGFDANKWPTKVDERWMKLGHRDGGTGAGETPTEANLRRLSSLSGLTIKNPAGDDLGSIKGFAVDLKNGKIVYAAMAHGGVAGVGSKYFAIPWQALEMKTLNLRAQDRCFVLNAAKADFDNNPGFDSNRWPIQADERFGKGGKKDSDKK